MKLQRFAGLSAVTLAGLLALTACGSDNNTTPAGGTGSAGGSGSGSSASSSGSSAGSSAGAVEDCGTGTLQAAGSSAQKPAMTAWITAYQQKCSSAAINYDAQGSGYGITQFSQGQVPLAGSDSHLKPEEQTAADQRCKTGKAIDLPMVATPVAFIYNLQGVDKLTVTPDVLAKVFSGKITKWNDPAIAKANPGVTLPATSITAVHRSKDSGTTDNFTKFLDAQAKGVWTYGTGKAWKAPGGIGAPDSASLVSQVKGTDGAIGYVDGPDATKNQLTPALLDVGKGGVAISADSVGKALDAADVKQDGNDIAVSINYGLQADGAYPAILVTYEITCDAGLPSDQAAFVKSFLTYTSGQEGQQALTAIGHLPLPDSLISKVRTSVEAIKVS